MRLRNWQTDIATRIVSPHTNTGNHKTMGELKIDRDIAKVVLEQEKKKNPIYYYKDAETKKNTSNKSNKTTKSNTSRRSSNKNSNSSSYDYYMREIERQNELLRQQLELKKKERERMYNYAINENDKQAEKSLNDAYILNMLAQKNLNQQLKSMGISGGLSETAITDINNSYMDRRNDIDSERLRANAKAREIFESQNSNDYDKYLDRLMKNQMKQEVYKSKQMSKGIRENTSKLPSNNIRNVAVNDAYKSSSRSGISENDIKMKNFLMEKYKNEGYLPHTIDTLLRRQGFYY